MGSRWPHILWAVPAALACTPALAQDAPGLDVERWDAIAVDAAAAESKDIAFTKDDKGDDKTAKDPADPHGGSRTWLAGDPALQRSRDTRLPPVMTGGIFVPAMTNGLHEPKVQIRSADGSIVREMHTGTTGYVPAGDYTVDVGSPGAQEPLRYDVHVTEGSVTTIPVEWSGLVVKVVNARSSAFRGDYEIVSLPSRSYIGLGTGALVHEGERIPTWILWPGQYMIISAGEGYQARKNFITVRLDPGELSRVTLVLDEETGDILGGGEIEDLTEDIEERWWSASAIVGGSVRFNRTDNVVGKSTGSLIDISAFLESYFTLNRYKHFFYTRLHAEIGGTIQLDDRPFDTSIDELNLELLYTYRVIDWFGPYARFSFESNMAPSWQVFSGEYTVYALADDGQTVASTESKNELKLSPAFSPIKLNMGAGGRFDVSVGTWLKIANRIGIAYRYVYADELFVVQKLNDVDKTVTIAPVFTTSQYGLEAALSLELTPIQWFTLKTDVSVLEPFDDWENPIIDLNLDAVVRLSSIASLSYSLRLNYDISMIDEIQLDQYIHLRFSYKIY